MLLQQLPQLLRATEQRFCLTNAPSAWLVLVLQLSSVAHDSSEPTPVKSEFVELWIHSAASTRFGVTGFSGSNS